ncbi:MAG TPA: hypothetical protein VFP00_03120 [Burkholderiales bacterium]|nr:hypothetical protein [Burkholderiales bacterium]
MQAHVHVAGALLLAAAASAWAVADGESVSIQDVNPACKERHSNVPEDQCVIQDRLPASQYARRFGGAVVLIDPALPLTREPRAVPEASAGPTERSR